MLMTKLDTKISRTSIFQISTSADATERHLYVGHLAVPLLARKSQQKRPLHQQRPPT
jgi:hypothetical protein